MVTYKGNPTGLSADFSAQTLQVRMERDDIFEVLKEKNCHPKYSVLQSCPSEVKER